MKAIYGSFEPPKDAIREHSPLLPPGRDRSSFNKDTETRKTGNADTRGPPKWDGERDFEGRPWWNKPSVGEAVP